ncbi:hypothetical protein HMI01_23210 [Halolactibacillus miurensis]|uniref:Probable membrane transporter protein n=1 Tax=Halolactibacillus miurensis TaxID=306541 RepID=A0A1I6Q0V6_9BACI|nr:sulfite exporter TauE/SafE family protein [Halolactibacillus miurensis]GEM05333.1 hypothetical protein HMI01_23210 [Halolactibacillus miurensis]SFS46052.1 hypothetical protein SAMN05421668_10322 [Halolactibacillus miurensis]
MAVIYFLVALVATLLGSLAGLGGGVIIKPILDLLGDFDLATISILSSVTVLSMAVVSMFKLKTAGYRFNRQLTVLIASGSIIGGVMGQLSFRYLIHLFPNLGEMQSLMLVVVMGIIFFMYNFSPSINRQGPISKLLIFTIGLLLGALSAFLGIGGGPLNVVILHLLFFMSPREASAHSVLIILFAQMASVISLLASGQFIIETYDILIIMVFGGILGGWIGAKLSPLVSNQRIRYMFNVTIILIALININNIL